MINKYYFLRHGETEKDKNISAIKWSLSKLGVKQMEEMVENSVFELIDVIVSSKENKAYETALPLASKINEEIIQMGEFNELKRGEKYLSKEEFENLKRKKLEDLDCRIDGGESGREALNRFESGIEMIDKKYKNKSILVVSHGTILSLYFAKISGKQNQIFNRWRKMKFCAWGLVENDMVIKDIDGG